MSESVRGRILWYELLTADLDAATRFYSDVIGWTVSPFDGASHRYEVFSRAEGVQVAGAMTMPAGVEAPPHWIMYVGIENLDDGVALVERLGGGAVSPVIEIPSVGRMRVVRDPQMAMFALYEPPAAPTQAEAEAAIGEGSWHELMAADAEAAMKFYGELFGWQSTGSMDMGEAGQYHMFGRTFPLGGMMNKPKELADVPPHWGVYFRVPNVHEAAERVKSGGGKVLNGPMEVPGGDWIINCMDPQGAAFSLHHRNA